MSNKDDGGAAFPVQQSINEFGNTVMYPELGMSLRDYFAAKAMQGLCANSHENYAELLCEILAVQAYEQADAMLAVRAGKLGKKE